MSDVDMAVVSQIIESTTLPGVLPETVNGHDVGDDVPETLCAWPKLENAAMYGILGELAQHACAHSEADPNAVLATALTSCGALLGRHRYTPIGDSTHHSRHMIAIVGQSSRARKGTSWSPVERVIKKVCDSLGSYLQISHGPLSSGEGMVYAVRDDDGKDDPGVDDKRLLVIEQEFGAALRAFQRQGNNLSMLIRMAYDGTTLAPMTKANRIIATDPHINILGHITKAELKELLVASDIWNGLSNRFLWICARRPRLVAFPKAMRDGTVRDIAKAIADAIKHAKRQNDGCIVMDDDAHDLWAHVYPELTQDHPGILGAVTSRQESHVYRVALTFAQLDGADTINAEHLEAALSFVRYGFDSAAYLFGGAELDPVAQTILDTLKTGPKTQNEIRNAFARHVKADRLNGVLMDLQERGRINLQEEKTGGRPRRVWSLV